jgi:glycosyltransferase involved in cell wall biosynthesis
MKNRCALLTAFNPNEFTGGIEAYTNQLARLLQRWGLVTDIYHTGNIPVSAKQWLRGVVFRKDRAPRPIAGPERNAFSFNLEQSLLLQQLYPLGRAFYEVDRRYDFVIAQAYSGFSYFPPRIPAFTILHSAHAQYADDNLEVFDPLWHREVHSLIGLGAERLSTIGKKVIAVSESVANQARALYQAQDILTVSTGIDRAVFFPRENRAELRDKYAVPRDAFVGLFLGRWGPEKAVDVLQEVIDRTPKVFWLLVLGSGLACPLQQDRRLRILSNLDPTGVAEALSLSDVLLHPARYEGFGLAIVEALACGLPVIAPPVGVMPRIAEDQPFRSLLLPSYTEGKQRVVASAVDAVRLLQQEASLCRALRQAGPKLVETRFDQRDWGKAMLAALGLAA